MPTCMAPTELMAKRFADTGLPGKAEANGSVMLKPNDVTEVLKDLKQLRDLVPPLQNKDAGIQQPLAAMAGWGACV